jgi:hypothetical protein
VKAWAALRPASVESRFEALRASGLTELFSCTGVASVTNAHRGALLASASDAGSSIRPEIEGHSTSSLIQSLAEPQRHGQSLSVGYIAGSRTPRCSSSASASSPTAQLALRKATILLQLLHFALEFRFVLKAIVTRQATHDFAAFPILEDTAQVFAGYSSHGRQVALPNLVPNDDAVRSDLPPEMIRQFEQRTGNPTSQRQEAPSGDRHVGLT